MGVSTEADDGVEIATPSPVQQPPELVQTESELLWIHRDNYRYCHHSVVGDVLRKCHLPDVGSRRQLSSIYRNCDHLGCCAATSAGWRNRKPASSFAGVCCRIEGDART